MTLRVQMFDDNPCHKKFGPAKLDIREGKSNKKNKAFAHKYTHTRNENTYADYVCATCKVNRDLHAIDCIHTNARTDT